MRVVLGGLAVGESESVSRWLFMHPAHRTIGVAGGLAGGEWAAAPLLWIVFVPADAVVPAALACLTSNAISWAP